jgi:hypothetical protein
MKINCTKVIITASITCMVLTVTAQLCPNTYYSNNNKVSACTDCSTMAPKGNSGCSMRIYYDAVLCDCRRDYRCYDDPDSEPVNHRYYSYLGTCIFGICVNDPNPVGGPVDDLIKWKCADPCTGA